MKWNLRVTALLLLLAAVGLCILGFWPAGEPVKPSSITITWPETATQEADQLSRAIALIEAGRAYRDGTNGMPSDEARGRELLSRAVSELRKVSEDEGRVYMIASPSGQTHEVSGFIAAQILLGQMLCDGTGIRADPIQGAQYFTRAAEKGSPHGQAALGKLFENGLGVPKNTELALKWYRAAAEQGDQDGQLGLGRLLLAGNNTPQNRLEAYKWFNLAAMGGNQEARVHRDKLEKALKPEEIARAQWFSLLFVRGAKLAEGVTNIVSEVERKDQLMTATGFFVSTEGHLVTAHHAVTRGKQFYVVDDQDLYAAKLLGADPTNDLAVLVIEGRLRSWPEAGSLTRFVMPVTKKFKPLAISEVQPRLGQPVATVGFPNPTLQGFKPKVTRGEVSGTAGIADDPRFVQISVPVQPGNSGGPLLDDQGNVIGVVCAELWAGVSLATSGSLPQNVNYAVKGSLLKSLLASVGGITSPQPRTEKLHNDLPAIAEMAVESVAIVIASSAEPPEFTVREVKETK